MSDSLTTIVSKVQASLLDAGTRFTTATITAACRQALSQFNRRAPNYLGEIIDAYSNQLEYTLDSVVFEGLINITDVLLWNTSTEYHTPLTHDAYFEDSQPGFRLHLPRTTGELIVVRYSKAHTVNGLDSETESTLPAFFDPILVAGTCYWSLQIRGTSRIEANNLDSRAPINYSALKDLFFAEFNSGLQQASMRKQLSSTRSNEGWEDAYHHMPQ